MLVQNFQEESELAWWWEEKMKEFTSHLLKLLNNNNTPLKDISSQISLLKKDKFLKSDISTKLWEDFITNLTNLYWLSSSDFLEWSIKSNSLNSEKTNDWETAINFELRLIENIELVKKDLENILK